MTSRKYKSWIKRALSLFLAVSILLVLAACDGGGDNPKEETPVDKVTEPETIENIRLPVIKSDKLDPFYAKTDSNRIISTLLYDSLFNINDDFTAEELLAQSYTHNDDTLTVKIKSGINFSDNTPLTAEDVVYSYNIASLSDHYNRRLNNFSSAEMTDSTTVVFTLGRSDPNAVNLLDFPIIKNGTYNKDKQSIATSVTNDMLPVGSGRYILSANDGKIKLNINNSRMGAYDCGVREIELVPIVDFVSIRNSIGLGDVSFIYDSLSSGVYKRILSTSKKITQTNFVFLGMNEKSAVLENVEIRQAINLILNREEIAENAFRGYAVPASSPFHPNFIKTQAAQTPDTGADMQKGLLILEQAGFVRSDEVGSVNASGDIKLKLDLIVNKDNEFKVDAANSIAQSLKGVGFEISVKEYEYEQYLEKIKKSEFDLYIGEIRLTNSLNLSAFFMSGGEASYGISKNSTCTAAYDSYRTGQSDLQSFIDEFNTYVAFAPLCYRQAIAAYTENLQDSVKCSLSDYFYSIKDWKTS